MPTGVFKEPELTAVWARSGGRHVSLPSQYFPYRMREDFERTWDTHPSDKGVAAEKCAHGENAEILLTRVIPKRRGRLLE
jgi:hypothetical protein